MPPYYTRDIVSRYVLRGMPEAGRLYEENRRESVATTVWIVGLASASLALAVTHPSDLTFLSRDGQVGLVTMLSLAIVGGVAHRVLLLSTSTLEVGMRSELHAYLNGLEPGDTVPIPRADYWSDEMIVESLQEDFGLDYSFLIGTEGQSDQLKKTYDDVYARWQVTDQERLLALADTMADISKLDRASVRASVSSATTDTVPIGAGKSKFGRTSYWAPKALVLSGASFALASVIVALGFAL